MTYSQIATRALPDYGKHGDRMGTPIGYLLVHHWAGTSGGDARLLNPSESVSASYILYGSGELVGQVPEDYRPWTSGSWAADAPAITVETQNSDNGGDWPVSDAALETLAQLAADLCRRYGWGRLDRGRVRGHREFYSTACPGPYLWARLDAIVARGNEILDNGEDDMTPEQAGQLKAIYDAQFNETPTSRGSSAGVLKVLGKLEGIIGAIYDAQFKETETSRGTPGGTLKTLHVVLEELAEIRNHLGMESNAEAEPKPKP